MGTVSPVGNSTPELWAAVSQGKSGAGLITRFDADRFNTRYAAEVKNFVPDQRIHRRDWRKMDRFTQYAVHAALEAWSDAGLPTPNEETQDFSLPTSERIGVVLGVGVGGVELVERSALVLEKRGPSRIDPMIIAKVTANMAPANIAIALGARGPAYAVATACASANDAIGNAMRLIRDGTADIIITGGAEAAITPLGIAGFGTLHALSTGLEGDPESASRPFDRDRNGFVLGEGAGVMILESLQSACRRGARVYAEVVGHGMSNDAFHLTAPQHDGEGSARAMSACMADAAVSASEVGYINAHGTSTTINDVVETQAIKLAFGQQAYSIPVSSTKSMIGHCMGAAGAIEGIASVLAIVHGFIPPTINLDNADAQCDLDYVPRLGRPTDALEYAMSNSLGFGGHNSVILYRRFSED